MHPIYTTTIKTYAYLVGIKKQQCLETTFCQGSLPKPHKESLLYSRMSVRVFADMLSQPARAVTIFCCAAHIPHQVVRLRVGRGDTRTKEFVKINPRMRVPVIQDGDFVLTESVAIMRYLARERAVEDHWYPWDSRS